MNLAEEMKQARHETAAQEEFEYEEHSHSWAESSYIHVLRLKEIADSISYEERLAISTVNDLRELANAYRTGVDSEDRATQWLADQMFSLATEIEKRYE